MENHHFSWENPLFLWSIFNSYVKLPEGNGTLYGFMYDLYLYLNGNIYIYTWISTKDVLATSQLFQCLCKPNAILNYLINIYYKSLFLGSQ